MNEKIIVSSIYTEDYSRLVHLQKESCKDNYLFDPILISNYEWEKRKNNSEFAFWDGNTIKVDAVISMIKKYWDDILLFTDADLVFFDKTESDILKELSEFDILFLKERSDKQKPYERAKLNINIGFVAMRCNACVLDFWEIVKRQVVEDKGWDQEIVNNLLMQNKNLVKWKMFSEDYLNGGSITTSNLANQKICTACGTVAQRKGLSKYDFLVKSIENYNTRNWFD